MRIYFIGGIGERGRTSRSLGVGREPEACVGVALGNVQTTELLEAGGDGAS